MWAINGGRRVRSQAEIEAVVDAVERITADWLAIFVCEADAVADHLPRQDLDDASRVEVMRNWPGPGALAQKLLLNRTFRGAVKAVQWAGRSCGVFLRSNPDSPQIFAKVIFSHLPPDGQPQEAFTDVAALARGDRCPAPVVWLGDLNIDLLPRDPFDPWAATPDRAMRHAATRDELDAFCEEQCLSYQPFTTKLGRPGGPYDSDFEQAPFTRIPIGAQPGTPAQLDHVFVTETRALDVVYFSWDNVPADHAFVGCVLPVKVPARTSPPPSTWRPRNPSTLGADLLERLPGEFVDVAHFQSWCTAAQ